CTVPIFADPVSVSKAGKLKNVLGRLHTLKPNRLEAEQLTGISIHTDADLARAADALLATGLKRVFLSLGIEGVFAAEAGQQIHVPCCPAVPKNMTGAGDAMLAGLVWSYLQEKDLVSSARLAAAAAAIAVEGTRTVNPALSPSVLLEKAALCL
ncbi:MAG: bifunctional hydroxymethylpyrimidine kinase/phosphomethylpyrimidine kinase, partial [Clostridia bacterium]|nr:bifunctional hydroxymethylpyrimidine kinase/phosphomethylpyrimidine kinase [Clostridia bacterium]